MKIPSFLKTAISAVNPLNLKDKIMNELILAALKKGLSSLTKGGVSVLIVALTGAGAALSNYVAPGNDHLLVYVVAGLSALIHAAISGLEHAVAPKPAA